MRSARAEAAGALGVRLTFFEPHPSTTTGDDEQMSKKILLAGETWISHKIEVKGFSSYATGAYGEGQTELVEALETHGHEVVHVANHVAARRNDIDSSGLETGLDKGHRPLIAAVKKFERAAPEHDRLRFICTLCRLVDDADRNSIAGQFATERKPYGAGADDENGRVH